MKVKCVICEQLEILDDKSFEAKRLRNRRINLYLCKKCYKRIEQNTKKRIATGKFRLYKDKKSEDHLI